VEEKKKKLEVWKWLRKQKGRVRAGKSKEIHRDFKLKEECREQSKLLHL